MHCRSEACTCCDCFVPSRQQEQVKYSPLFPRSQPFEQFMPMTTSMPIVRTSTAQQDDRTSSFAEKDFDDGLDKFFRDQEVLSASTKSSTEPQSYVNPTASFSKHHSPPAAPSLAPRHLQHSMQHQKSHFSASGDAGAEFAKNYETYLQTLVQQMKSTEKSRLKVANLKMMVTRKWKHHQQQPMEKRPIASARKIKHSDTQLISSQSRRTRSRMSLDSCHPLPYTAAVIKENSRRKENTPPPPTSTQLSTDEDTDTRYNKTVLQSYKMQFFPDCA